MHHIHICIAIFGNKSLVMQSPNMLGSKFSLNYPPLQIQSTSCNIHGCVFVFPLHIPFNGHFEQMFRKMMTKLVSEGLYHDADCRGAPGLAIQLKK